MKSAPPSDRKKAVGPPADLHAERYTVKIGRDGLITMVPMPKPPNRTRKKDATVVLKNELLPPGQEYVDPILIGGKDNFFATRADYDRPPAPLNGSKKK